MNWREKLHTLPEKSKKQFFDGESLENIRRIFLESPEDYGGIKECCNTHISWGVWDEACEQFGFQTLINLPEAVYCVGDEWVEEWLDVVDLLTSYPKITKTFKELL